MSKRGLAQEFDGPADARAAWGRAADEPRPTPDALTYYRALALRKLGRRQEAESELDRLLTDAARGDDGGARSPAESRFMEGLALKGKGRPEEARARFAAALSLQPGHRRAAWEQSGFVGG